MNEELDIELEDEETEEELDIKEILEDKRDDMLLYQIIEEFCSKFNGQITRDEVTDMLTKNGFNGVYVISDEDYRKVHSRDFRGIDTVGTYLSDFKVITLKESYKDSNLYIGCHELTHALLNDRLSFSLSNSEGVVSYGIGFEEGIATAIERREGNHNLSEEEGLLYGYEKNYNIISELDLLYKRSPYMKYDSIIVEALKRPEMFFNLVYRIVLDNLKEIVKASSLKLTEDEIKLMALKCSFINLHTTDMLVEFLDKNSSKEDVDKAISAASLARVVNICLLSNCEPDLRKGEVAPEFVGPFNIGDFNLIFMKDEDRLFSCLFGVDNSYFARLVRYLERAIIEYVNIVDMMEKPMDIKLIELK